MMINNYLFKPSHLDVVEGFSISVSKSFHFPFIHLYILLSHLFFYIFPFFIYFSTICLCRSFFINFSIYLFHLFHFSLFYLFFNVFAYLFLSLPSFILTLYCSILNLLVVAVALKVTFKVQ